MPCIKTKEWLKKTIIDFPSVSYDKKEVDDILEDKSFGSIYFWKQMYDNLKMMKTSYSSTDILLDLYKDINIYGLERECIVYYYEKDDNIIFYDYQFDDEVKEYGIDDDLKDKNYAKMSIGEAYSYFSYQDEIL